MSDSAVLAAGLASLGTAIVMMVLALRPARARQHGVAGALAAIEQRYARHAPVAAPGVSDPLAELPGWVRGLAVRLSPAGIPARCSAGWISPGIRLAGHQIGYSPSRGSVC